MKKSERKFIIADPQKCNGCGVCELVCSASKDKIFNRRMSRVKLVKVEPAIDLALACRLCDNPPCVESCPQKALTQEEQTGVIIVDDDKCNGCGWCMQACIYGVITYDPSKKTVTFCDVCDGEPICIAYCVHEALQLMTMNEVSEKIRNSAVRRFFITNLGVHTYNQQTKSSSSS